jgi:hypothetical protein
VTVFAMPVTLIVLRAVVDDERERAGRRGARDRPHVVRAGGEHLRAVLQPQQDASSDGVASIAGLPLPTSELTQYVAPPYFERSE